MTNEAVVRSRPKIQAVIDNAHTLLELDAEHRGFRRYLKAWGDTAAVAAAARRVRRLVAENVTGGTLAACGHFLPEERPAEDARIVVEV